MAQSVAQRDQVVAEAIREISHIATLPEITLKIVELVESDEAVARDVERLLTHLDNDVGRIEELLAEGGHENAPEGPGR